MRTELLMMLSYIRWVVSPSIGALSVITRSQFWHVGVLNFSSYHSAWLCLHFVPDLCCFIAVFVLFFSNTTNCDYMQVAGINFSVCVVVADNYENSSAVWNSTISAYPPVYFMDYEHVSATSPQRCRFFGQVVLRSQFVWFTLTFLRIPISFIW